MKSIIEVEHGPDTTLNVAALTGYVTNFRILDQAAPLAVSEERVLLSEIVAEADSFCARSGSELAGDWHQRARALLATQPQPAVAVPQGVSDRALLTEIEAWLCFRSSETDEAINKDLAALKASIQKHLATPPDAKVQVGDERDAFECRVYALAEKEKYGQMPSLFKRDPASEDYATTWVDMMWRGWQARASVATPQPTAAAEQHDKDSEVRG